MTSVISLLYSCKKDSCETKITLYDYISKWVRYLALDCDQGSDISNLIEKAKLRFLKRLFIITSKEHQLRITTGSTQ